MTNLVLIHTDDTGRFLGPYGYDIDTPNVQALADDGLLFRQAFCTAPQCSPSRGSVMTGQYPHSNGLIGLCLGDGAFAMDDYSHHLVPYLGEHGFETVLAGQQHEAHPDEFDSRREAARSVIGYDRVLDPDQSVLEGRGIDDGRTETDLSNTAAVVEYLQSDPGDPFFLSLGLWNSKDPQHDQDAIDPAYVRPPDPLPDLPAIREEWAGFMRNVEYADECVGEVMDALRTTDLLEDTIVVFTTDHGPQFPWMKCDLFDEGIGIALLARFPEGYRAGEAEDALVSNVDLFPTFCERLGVPIPEWVEGTSLMPLVRGEATSVREEIFAELTFHAAYEPKRCIRTDQYKYIKRFGDPEHVPVNTDPTVMKDTLADFGLFDRERPREALYDCYLDPGERNNLVNNSEYHDIYSELSDRLEAWMGQTNDPLLEGPVPHPPGWDGY